MKIVIGVMVGYYFCVFVLGQYVSHFLFQSGGVSESYLKPIYIGMIVLSGIIVGCTIIILDEIKQLKKDVSFKNNKDKN